MKTFFLRAQPIACLRSCFFIGGTALMLFSTSAGAQSNSYPTAGNVKIFATDASWAEGVTVVKPSGWGGLRFTRVDPAGGSTYNGNWAIGYNGNTGNDFSISNSYGGTQYDYLFHISASTRNVGIGTSSPAEKLSVNGKILAKEIKVTTSGWPDYVFMPSHRLPGLNEVSAYIRSNGHLPEIPSAAEAEKEGINLGEMNNKLLKKIEELTLYLIEQDKRIQELEKKQRTTSETQSKD